MRLLLDVFASKVEIVSKSFKTLLCRKQKWIYWLDIFKGISTCNGRTAKNENILRTSYWFIAQSNARTYTGSSDRVCVFFSSILLFVFSWLFSSYFQLCPSHAFSLLNFVRCWICNCNSTDAIWSICSSKTIHHPLPQCEDFFFV